MPPKQSVRDELAAMGLESTPPFDSLETWLVDFFAGTSAPDIESIEAARSEGAYTLSLNELNDPTYRARCFLLAATGSDQIDASRPVTVSFICRNSDFGAQSQPKILLRFSSSAQRQPDP
jgi:hypothetical protein